MGLLVNSVAPVTVRVLVRTTPDSGLDLSTVTGATISARKPKVSEVSGEAWEYSTWTPTRTVVSPLLLVLTYALQAGDVDRVGKYHLAVDLTVPAGAIPCTPAILQVDPKY